MKNLLSIACLVLCAGMTSAQLTGQDGKTYKTITVGNQTWMAENLNVSTYRNGDTIPQVQDPKVWYNLKSGAWCYYENKMANGVVYGKLYNWYAISDPRGIAPVGWHIPSDAEWNELTSTLGGRNGSSLKIKATKGWANNGNGTNETGFNALPGGTRSVELFSFESSYGYWWTSTEFDSYSAWNRFLSYNNGDIGRSTGWKQFGNSIRCIKGEAPPPISKYTQPVVDDSKQQTPASADTSGFRFLDREPGKQTVKIGEMNWALQNLDADQFQNGDFIPQARTNEEWIQAGKSRQPAWCYYDNDTANAAHYGKLYNWYAVTDKRGLAPKSYHIPDSTEWSKLINQLGPATAGTQIKSGGGWIYKRDDSTHSSFNGYPGGFRNPDGQFFSERVGGYWWSSSESTGNSALYYNITYFNDVINKDAGDKQKGISVRCVRD